MHNPTGAYRRIARLVNAVGIPLAILALLGAVAYARFLMQEPCWHGPLGPKHTHLYVGRSLTCYRQTGRPADPKAGRPADPWETEVFFDVEPPSPETRKP